MPKGSQHCSRETVLHREAKCLHLFYLFQTVRIMDGFFSVINRSTSCRESLQKTVITHPNPFHVLPPQNKIKLELKKIIILIIIIIAGCTSYIQGKSRHTWKKHSQKPEEIDCGMNQSLLPPGINGEDCKLLM